MLRYLCLILCLFALPQSLVLAQANTPSAPTSLSASVRAEGVYLSWTAPTGQVDGYEILRRRPAQNETELVTLASDTGSSDTRYADTSATTLSEQYIYGIKTIRGESRSEVSSTLTVDYPATRPISVSQSCAIIAGSNHDILQCTVTAENTTITSAKWTPSHEAQYAQTTTGPVVNWVIADEYCGQSTEVVVNPKAGETALSPAETTITLACTPAPADVLAVSCENVIESSQHKLSCKLSGGDQTITSATWTPAYDTASAQTTTGTNASEATWVVSADDCGQTTSVSVVPTAGETTLSTVTTSFSLACLINVDDNCSLANAIRSANGEDQVEESGDSDGNDDCETGASVDSSATPPKTGDDIILLKKNITLGASPPALTSRVQFEGAKRSISGDDKYQAFSVDGGKLSISDLTITKGLSSTLGGAIYVTGGALRLNDSEIKNSTANDIGGAIYAVDSDVDIVNSKITGNSTVKSHGGGVYFVSSTGLHELEVDGATFKKNEATEDGGALKTAGGIATVKKSTFVENTADEGGAIESSETTLGIVNSTFSKNSAREGGGLSSFSSFVTLTHTTWAYNSADEQGGGIAIIGWTGSFKIRNTLITDSSSGGDCHSGPNPNIIIEFTGNYIKDGSCAPQVAESQAAADGAVIEAEAQHAEQANTGGGSDPQIGGLTGDPPHHPLRWGSLAIDSADPLYCLLDDQPDTARPQYGNCDIGAYEYPKAPPAPGPSQPRSPDDSEDPDDPDDPDATPDPKPPAATPTATQIPLTPTLSPDCIHIVTEGENLFRIAILYSMTVREISSFNNLLRDDQLSVGQALTIPFDHCKAQTPRKG